MVRRPGVSIVQTGALLFEGASVGHNFDNERQFPLRVPTWVKLAMPESYAALSYKSHAAVSY